MRVTRPAVAIASSAAVATMLVGAGPAHAAGQLNPSSSFTMTVHQDGSVTAPSNGEAVPNIDSVKSTLRAYYGAGATKQTDPAHAFSDLAPATTYLPNLTDSPYAKNTEAVAQTILDGLPATHASNAAVVFDVDSTLLSDYGNEEDSNFNYSADLNEVWVDHELFPAIAGMPALLQEINARGYKIYGITGRPASQESATIGNLTNEGFTTTGTPGTGTALFTADNLYTKDLTTQPWVDPTLDASEPGGDATKASTVEYKALTRKHIEDTDDVHFVMNVGDQWSDLEGGYADATQKMPNPSYFLPSPTIPSTSDNDTSGDAAMVPPTSYTMKPDGSTGATTTDGDTIPNEGAVVSDIRAYYKATGGIADKTGSPYISQLKSLESAWTPKIATSCQQGAAKLAAAKTSVATAHADVLAATKAVKKATKAVTKDKKKVKKARGHHAKKVAKKKLKAAKKTLKRANATLVKATRTAGGITLPKTPAVVFDADDTTLWNYDLEDGAMGFNYSPATAATWIQQQKFPALPGMVALAKAAKAAGCTIVGLTGRTSDQQADTIANLTKVGYVDAAGKPLFTAANYYTKWLSTATPPAYMDCGDDKTCSTIEYKAGTREYIETQKGLDIVANLGDQYSDLHGGYADATYKIPNPTYYLP